MKRLLPCRNRRAPWLAFCLLFAGCASNASGRKPAAIAPSATEHPGDIQELVTTVDGVMNDRDASPPAPPEGLYLVGARYPQLEEATQR